MSVKDSGKGSAVAKAVIGGRGGGGVHSYIRVLPDEFLLKSVVLSSDDHGRLALVCHV